MTFLDSVIARQRETHSMLCVGLDPDPGRFPEGYGDDAEAILRFNQMVIDATAGYACCVKPQHAHYAARRAEAALEGTIEYAHSKGLPVLLDVKRADIGSTAEYYAAEAFDRYGADAATVNPYLGQDALAPFLDRSDRGIVVLCRTSNPGGADLQHLQLAEGGTLFEHVARLASTQWNAAGNVLLLVGATRPAELRRVREIVGGMGLLLAGVGAQGADVRAMMEAGKGGGLIINSSRGVTYPDFTTGDPATLVADAARKTRDEINQYL
ncbi:MAG: orotidine-5'-phosphate decarboxylase [Gammaproteobacteria bacterium]|nr:orotidine-5'-phosphate decarboxylase [Gammaproteobacteria bacterium]